MDSGNAGATSTTGGAFNTAGADATGGEANASGGAGGAFNTAGANATGGTMNGSGGMLAGSAGEAGVLPSCDENSCQFLWPIRGNSAQDWIITNYVDLQPGAGIADFNGGSFTYDGHAGLDIAIANFRTMDGGVRVYAVAPGEVTQVHDGEEDRNQVSNPGGCDLAANHIYVKHPDGREGRYLHLKKSSIAVAVGDRIEAGQLLGEVGSSGCSQSPHLHFELREANSGDVLESLLENVWLEPPNYDQAPGLLDFAVHAGNIEMLSDAMLVPENPNVISGVQPSFVTVTGGTQVGSVIEVLLQPMTGSPITLQLHSFDGSETHYAAWWNQNLASGAWTAQPLLDGTAVGDPVAFTVE